jgi:acyl-CoA synthetase (AMP-forming)/AMP-acid ligase II
VSTPPDPSLVPGSLPDNIASLLADTSSRHGARVAMIDRGRTITYEELAGHAGGVAAALRDAGAAPGDRVAIFLERGHEAMAAYFGALAAGCIATFVNERLRPRQIEHVLRHTSARVLVTSRDMLGRQHRPLETDALVLEAGALPARGALDPHPVGVGQVAQLIYTSGSTGLPKGVAFTHEALWLGSAAVARYLALESDDRLASLLPFSSVYGLNQLLGAAHVGAALVIERSPVPQQIVSQLRDTGTTVLAAVPPLWLQLLGAPAFAEPIPTLRILQNAGGHLPTEAVRRIRAAQPHARLFLQYGMTETFRSTYLDPGELAARPGSMGKAVPGGEVLVLREDLSECAPDEVGELVFRAPWIAAGYWNDTEATGHVFRTLAAPDGAEQRVVFSGDMVRRDHEGFLYFVARRDRLIKSLGFRIGPDEIVDVLFASGEINEATVFTEDDAQRGERVVASVVLAPGGSAERLRRFCGAELPRHMQPSRIDVRAELPRLPSGKYDLSALRAPGAGAIQEPTPR